MTKTFRYWMFLAIAIAISLKTQAQTTPISINVQISSANDDAEEFSSGYMILGSSDIEMVNDNGSDVTSGLRFQNILLPIDATINSARIEFYVDETSSVATNLNIRGQVGNAAVFSNSSNNITSRTTTSASVNWQPGPWTTINASGANQRTPDLTTVVQQMISGSSWTEGNALAFIISGSGLRTAQSYNKNPSRSARLIIEAVVDINTTLVSGVVINEVAPFASDYLDEEGKREDWVELYNTTNSSISVGGLWLSDKASSPDKWQIPPGINIPAGGYLTIFCDGDLNDGPLHADFSFKASGEAAVLSQQTASGFDILDQVAFSDVAFESSYARRPNGTGNFVKVGTPTPNASNNGSLLYITPPVIQLASGLYSGSQSITITHPDNSVTIKYTTDGSDPSSSSSTYNGPFSITQNTAVRAIAIRSGYANSKPAQEAYLINESPNIDVIFITTDPDNFFDDQIGIYVDGTNGIQSACAPYPVNWGQDWERPANFKMFKPDGTMVWDVNAGVEINGVCSRNNAMKSLGINLREKTYGDKEIEYQLYPTRDHEEYQRLKLRNSGQDFIRMGFRDMVNQQLLVGKVDLDMQEGIPTIVFLNGDFWGLHNLREKFSGEYFEAIYGVKEKDLDIIKSPGVPWREVKEGTDEIYNDLNNFVQNADMNNSSDLQYFEANVDVNEMLNYWIFMTYLANYDWPANNLKIWRERKAGEKWRYGVEDTDGSTQNMLGNQAEPEFNTLESISDPNSTDWPNHSGSTLFLRKLIENPTYKAEWVQRTCSFINLFFDPAVVNAKTDEIKNLYLPNVQRHLNKWGSGNAMGGSQSSWNSWINFYKDFFATRPDYYRGFMQSQYNLSGTFDLTVNFDGGSGGTVKVNSNEMDLPFNYQGKYMRGLPVRLTAVPNSGYTFQYWLETGQTNPVINVNSNSNVTRTPIFTTGNCTPGNSCNDGDACTINDVFDSNCNCVGTFADSDGDGVCNADDQCPGFDDNVDNNNNGVPDGCEPNCTDNDNDGVCQADDCNDNNAAIPATPGTSCDDGNSNTVNDVILADGCSCAGTPVSGDPCDNLTITSTNGQITISGLSGAPHADIQIFDPNWNGVFSCFVDCAPQTQVVTLAANTYYVKISLYDDSFNKICEFSDYYTVTNGGGPCSGSGGDSDGDGICAADDCDDNNASIPTSPGTSCNDGDPNTVNDQIQSDGCSCQGTPITNPCNNAGGDNDGDGVCAADDCDDNDASIPTNPGTSCNDGNPNTNSDQIQSDGCTCLGIPVNTGNYCDSEGDFPWHEWINKVKFNTIDNSSSKNKYSNFTFMSTNINSGATYNIELGAGFSWETWDEHFNVWIDFNGDKVFNNSNELVYSGVLNNPSTGTNSATKTATITLPTFNENGSTTRMRVSMQRQATPSSCGVLPFGEVEDYSVVLGSNNSNPRLQLNQEELHVYPVPSADWVTINFPNTVMVKNVKIISATGIEIFRSTDQVVEGDEMEISVADWQEGIYFIQAEVETGKWRYGKIIVTGNK